MKKLMSLLMALILLVSVPALALTPEEVPGKLKQLMEDYLNPRGIPYAFNEERMRFEMDFDLDNALETSLTFVNAYDDMLRVIAFSPVYVPEENRDAMAKLLVMINYKISYATFHMDFSDGEVSCIAFQYVEDVIPTPKEVDVMVRMPIEYLDIWGDAIVQVGEGGDPQEVFDAVLAE